VTLQKEKGAITARLAYEKDLDQTDYPQYRNMSLTVLRSGKVVLTKPLCADGSCDPSTFGGALDVRNVWGSPQAEVFAELYTGGAHCCFATELVLFAGGAWRTILHDWGDLGYRGQWHDGTYWFITGDDRFAYAFTDFADSAFPMAVWTINGVGHLVEVTRQRLDLVAANATTLYKGYLQDKRTKTDVRGVLAAWCADEYLLGAAAMCDSTLQQALKAGLLRTGVHIAGFGPIDAEYIKQLKGSLVAWGYAN
jgi:hypothetical protein